MQALRKTMYFPDPNTKGEYIKKERYICERHFEHLGETMMNETGPRVDISEVPQGEWCFICDRPIQALESEVK